jgi:RNA polymerase sigma-70 factor (ECF subfamily)
VDWESIEREDVADARIIPFPSASHGDPEKTMAKKQVLIILERAIDTLPEPFRVVFVARAVEEMTVEQTAEALGIRPETVKTRLHRARNLLREYLEKQFGPLLQDIFPFEGERCERTAKIVIARLSTRSALSDQ